MNKISRKGFLKIAAAAAMSGVTAGALAACNSASSSTAASSAAAPAGTYIPGTYEGTAEGISSTVKVTMTFSDSAVTNVVVDTSGETASYGAAAADQLKEQLLAAGSAEIDGVSGSTITSDAVMKAAKSCYAQAKGEAVVSSVQLPTGDENDWLGKEPDIDEAAITETVDTDILIVGAGNGGMFAAAYAAANGLNFRIIEQNAVVQDTRHWYGAIDSAAAKAAGAPATDKAKLLSEISRYASGKCDQRVVKTWINESAAMHDFMRSILEDKFGWECEFTSGAEAAWPAENAEHNTDYLYPVQEHNYRASESAAGLQRNEALQQYIEELGYGIDFKTSLAKLEKDSSGRITGVIAQSTEDDHFIRYNANQGVLLACGGFPGNPYMMEQLDPLGTSVTTACSYSPADKGYGIRAAVWAGANLDKEAAPMLFDRGIVAPGVDGGYVDSENAFGGKAFPGFPLIFASFKIIAEKIFFCNTDGMLWNGQLVNYKASSLRVNGMGEKIKSGSASGILRIVFVICPGKKYFSWLYKAAHIIDMAVGFVVVNTKRQPDDFLDRKILPQLFFNFRFCKRRIAPRTQQTFFGRKQGSFPVNMDGAAFQNKGVGLVAVIAKLPTDFFRHKIVLLPVGVKSIHGSSPGVELPVNATDSAFPVHHKGRCHIPRPGIVGLHADHMDLVSRIPG